MKKITIDKPEIIKSLYLSIVPKRSAIQTWTELSGHLPPRHQRTYITPRLWYLIAAFLILLLLSAIIIISPYNHSSLSGSQIGNPKVTVVNNVIDSNREEYLTYPGVTT